MREALGAFLCLILFILAVPLCAIRNISGFTKALDALVNVCLFNGIQGESVSSHAGRWLVAGNAPLWARFVDRFTNVFEPDHCQKHIQSQFIGERL